MPNDTNVEALIKNIEAIKWGALSIAKNDITNQPKQLIQIVKADAEGFLYFFIAGVNNKDTAAVKKYYANLVFEEKAKAIQIQLRGYVCAANEIPANDNSETSYLFLKFKIMQAEVTDFTEEGHRSVKPGLLNLIKNIWQPTSN